MRHRKRDARHPIVIATFAGLSYITLTQLFYGPEGSSVVQAMTQSSQTAFAAILLLSCLACIAAAWIGHEPRGAKIERAGMIGAGIALLYYSQNLPEVIPGAWSGSLGFGFAFTGLGCLIRAGLVWRMIKHKETW